MCLLQGSARSSILGEATINMAGYISSRDAIPVSLPLKNCNHGTILQVVVQCLTPRIKHRDEKSEHTNLYVEDVYSNYDDGENKSEVSDYTFTKSVGSSSSNNLDGTSHPGDFGSRETSFSASGSHYSFDSMEGSLGRESLSSQINISGIVKHVTERRDSGSGRHLQIQREDSGQVSPAITTSPLQSGCFSRNLPETEEITIEELRAEARMWERNARKLLLDQELLMKEFADQSKQLTNLHVEFSSSRTECDRLKQEIEHLKVLLEESTNKQKAIENLKFQSIDRDNIQKVLEDEIKFQKESNHDLAQQLKKTQDSNLELVSLLQEMEETIEKQKVEIENLSMLKSKLGDTGKKYSFSHEDNAEVNSSKEVSAEKMRNASCDLDMEGIEVEHPTTDLHAEFEQEDNWNAELQLQQLREAQKNLECTIQYLEKTLEEKNHEIEIERDLKTQTLQDCKAEWSCKLSAKEEEIINLEAKLSEALSDKKSEATEFENRVDLNLIREIKALKVKVQKLERDCNELTDENMELLRKVREARRYLPTDNTSFSPSSNKHPANNSPVDSESEVGKIEFQKCQFEDEIRNEEIPIGGVAANQLRVQCVDLENKCADAEKDSQSQTAIDKFDLLPALSKQLQLLLVNVRKQKPTLFSPVETENTFDFNNSYILKFTELTTQKELEEAVLDNLVQINKLLEAKLSLCEDDFPCSETMIRSTNAKEVHDKLEGDNLKSNTLCACSQRIHDSIRNLESRVADLSKELLVKTSPVGELSANRLLKEEETEALRHCQMDLETQISYLQKIKELVEENTEIMQRESSVNLKCLDNLRNDLTVLSSSMESHTSDNKALEMKSLELESAKRDLELHLSELEEENVHLSGMISGLEAQLRYMIDAMEASCLELQHSESHVINLQADVRRLENEMQAQKASMKQKMGDIQKQWLEAQEECEYLKKANQELQATAESLIEERSSLQKSNTELRQQKTELQEFCTVLEVELKESQNRFSNNSRKIEALEAGLSAFMEEINSREEIFNLELDALRKKNKEYKKLVLAECLLNQTNLEKAAEIENLQQELAASKENHETLVDNHEKLLGLLGDVRSNEEKLKFTIDKLESKLKSSEYERLQLAEEISNLKIQLLRIPPLRDEVLALKASLFEAKFENERVETSLELLSGDYEEAKKERISLLREISSMQKATSELENCRHSKVALEEKILRLEGTLIASEAICSPDAELKNELGQIRRVNSQFQTKIKHLEEEKEEWLQRAQALEEELRQKKELKWEQVISSSNLFLADPGSSDTNNSIENKWKQSKDTSEQYDHTTCSPKIADDTVSRIKVLEYELAEALEANDMYKSQLNSLRSEPHIAHSDTLGKLLADNRTINEEENKQKVDLLEAELRDIRERYFHMSLKCAEVEAEREQLVMKLKGVNSEKSDSASPCMESKPMGKRVSDSLATANESQLMDSLATADESQLMDLRLRRDLRGGDLRIRIDEDE
ncbi:hypothetical protein U1Q18_021923 [Sarracenia purpurea var. burkii]